STNVGGPGGGVIEVYNNTFYNCGGFPKPPYDDSRAGVMNGGGNPKLQIRVRNNIFFQAGGIPYVRGARISGSNNIFFGSGPVPGNMAASIQRNPMFVDLTQGNFHLAVDSPARKAGTGTGLNTDRDGNSRPASQDDLGAFQYPDADGSVVLSSA